MASCYPPPPSISPSDAAAEVDAHDALTQPQPPLASPLPTVQQQFEGSALHSPASQSAVVTAHHGLQALQAATAARVSPLAPVSGSGDQYDHYAPMPPPQPPDDQQEYSPRNGLPAPTNSPAARQTRLRRACDMCSARKVKCDEAGPPCRPCATLKVECTFSREMKRRGPPNKHAEAAKAVKRARLDTNLSPSPHHAAETLVSIAATDAAPRLDAESIAPWDILVPLVDDFFTYIYPLTPFPHEPTFRQSFVNREDQSNPEFLALLASMIGVLVASFPRSARSHLKAQQGADLFPRAITLINRCRFVALEARGPMFSGKEKITVYDAATSYFLGLAAGYSFQWMFCRRFFAETISFVQEMGFHRRHDQTQQSIGLPFEYGASEPKPINHIEDQMGKRIFWIMILAVRSMTQLGASSNEIPLPPETEVSPYPDRPVEVDDEFIFADQITPQPPGTASLLTGFNRVVDIYMTMNKLVIVEFAYGITQLPWPEQKTMLDGCLRAVREVFTRLPPELSLNVSQADGSAGFVRAPSTEYFDDLPGFQYYPPAGAVTQANDLRLVIGTQPQRRRQVQFDIQKSNIHVSQIATRSYYVELYLNLRDTARKRGQLGFVSRSLKQNGGGPPEDVSAEAAAVEAAVEAEHSDSVDSNMTSDRELIVQNLLTVLASIPQRNMEPNGTSVINKIRQVASTLLNDSEERKGPVAKKAEQYLGAFVEILMRLEKTSGASREGSAGMTPADEEQELRNWADLEKYQLSFAQNGGFFGK